MATTEPAKQAARRPRRWLKRMATGLLVGMALLALFHRPLIQHGARWLAIRMAGQSHLKLDLHVGGNLYDRLVIRNVSATSIGPGTLQELQVGSLEIRYNLGDLIRRGMPGFLKSVRLRDVRVVLDGANAAKAGKPPAVAQDSGPRQIPAWLPGVIKLHNINVTARNPAGDTEVQGFAFTLLPDGPGELKILKLTSPATGTLEHLSATTLFRDKNLQLSGLSLGPELRTELINVDASKLDHDELGVQVRGQFFGGHAALVSRLHDIRKVVKAEIDLQAEGVSLDRAGTFFKVPLHGGLPRLALRVSGEPGMPSSWTGGAEIELASPGCGTAVVDKAALSLKMAAGRMELSQATLNDGHAEVRLDASAALPATLGEIANTPVQGHFMVDCPDLAEVAAKLAIAPLGGRVSIQGVFDRTDAMVGAHMTVKGDNLSMAENHAANSELEFSLSKKIRPQAPLLDGLETRLSMTLAGLQAVGCKAETVKLEASSSGAQLQVQSLHVQQQGNVLQASGSYLVPPELGRITQGQAHADFSLSAPNLATFAPGLSGVLDSSGSLSGENGQFHGKLQLTGKALRFSKFFAEQAQADVTLAGKDILLDKLAVQLQAGDFVSAQGKASLDDALPYSGSVNARVRDLAVYQPWLQAAGRNDKVAGSLDLAWKGAGEGRRMKHSGDLALSIHDGTFGTVTAIQTEIAGTYSPDVVELPKFSLSSSLGSLSTHISLHDSKLQISDLAYSQGNQQFATAQVLLPLDLAKLRQPELLVPLEAALSVHVVSSKLDLKKLAEQFHLPPQATGLVTGSLDATGSLHELSAALKIQGRELQSPALPKLTGAAFDLDLVLKNNRFDLNAAVTKPDFLPLKVTGTVPFNLQQTLADKKLNLDAPLDLAVRMPKSSMAFVSTLVPALRYVEGDAAVDFKAGGTIAKPVFSGDAALNLPAVRFTDPKTPALAEVKAALAFVQGDLVIHQFHGEIGGGPFSVGGRIKLANPAEPDFDLTVQGDHLAVLRNNSLTVRVNTHLKVVGPLKAGMVSGTIGVTDSRFFRDVDILPIGLPGRPTAKATKPSADRPVPPVETAGMSAPTGAPPFSLGPPLNDWKFDVKIRSDTPFLVRGNLANGAADIDLKLTGTGAEPALDGVVKVADLAATLPFSKLMVESGYVYFTPETGINPRLEIQATSEIRNYTVRVYISGPSDNPQTTFSSEPPLAQEDIVALLATGTTTKELTDSPDLLAGRAAALVFQKLYHKVFKQNEPSEEKSVLDRFQVDTAGVGRNGSQAVNTTFSLSEHFQLIGQIDLEGNVGGQIKYVMRFK